MGDALRRLFLSLGVALGLASGQADPRIAAQAAVAEDASGDRVVLVSARVDNAFAPGARELVDTGTRVALRYSAKLVLPGGQAIQADETRSLWFDMRSSRYGVGFEGGKTAALVDPQAAQGLAAQLSGLRLCREAEAGEGARVVIEAQIGIIDARGAWHDAPVLWNYSRPRAVVAIASSAANGAANGAARSASPGGR